MLTKPVIIGPRLRVGGGAPLALIAGPCVMESERWTLKLAESLAKLARRRKIPLIFKASYDKANRTSHKSYRGPGLIEGLRILDRVKRETGLPVLTDVHETDQVVDVAGVADVLQIPAFLCRQTERERRRPGTFCSRPRFLPERFARCGSTGR